MPPKPFQQLTVTGSGTTLSASFSAPSAGWDKSHSRGQAQWATNSSFSNDVTSSQAHPPASTYRDTDFPITMYAENLGNNTTYYYRVRHADKAGNVSDWLPLPSATQLSYTTPAGASPPNAPSQPTITDIQDTQFSFSWTGTAGTVGYKIYGSTSPGASVGGTLLATQTGNTYTWTSRTANQTYYVAVKGYNSAGDSSPSADRTVKTMVVDPSAPTAAQGSNPTQNTISWSLVSGATITKVYGGTSSNPTNLIRTDTSSGTSYTHEDLDPATTYYYRIKQSNQNGYDSGYSSDDSQITRAMVAPSSVTGTPMATDNAISWTEGTYTTRTYVYWSSTSGGTKNAAYTSATPHYYNAGTTSDNVDDLYEAYQGSGLLGGDNDVEYMYFRAAYANSSGTLVYSDYSSEYAAYSLPPTPTSFAAAQGSGEGEIDLSWSESVGSGALTVTYIISRATSSGGSFSVIASNISSGTTTHTDSGLDGSTTYYYKITGTTSAGNSAASSEVNATTQATSGPNPSNEGLEFGDLNVLINRGNATSEVSMNDVTGDTNEASLKDFFVGGFTSVTKNTDNIAPGQYALLTANFSNAGTRFTSKVAKERFSWSITSGGSYGNLSNQSGRTIRCNSAGTYGNYTVTVSCTWTPVFNDHVTTNLTRTVNVQMVNVGA